MKKPLSFLVGLVLLICLSACGEPDTTTNTPTESTTTSTGDTVTTTQLSLTETTLPGSTASTTVTTKKTTTKKTTKTTKLTTTSAKTTTSTTVTTTTAVTTTTTTTPTTVTLPDVWQLSVETVGLGRGYFVDKVVQEDGGVILKAVQYSDHGEDMTALVKYDANGALIDTEVVMGAPSGSPFSDVHVLSDNGGFYQIGITSHYSEDGISSAIKNACAARKGNEIYVARFDKHETLLWVKAYGSVGNDALEKVQRDAAGNLYLAVIPGGADEDFHALASWQSTWSSRALLKLSPEGELQYATPLCTRTMAIDMIGDIHICGDEVVVTGNAYASDPFLKDIPCEGANGVDLEDGARFKAYAHRIDANGIIVNSVSFLTEMECLPRFSHLFPNGNLLFAGRLCDICNHFQADLRGDVPFTPVLFRWNGK